MTTDNDRKSAATSGDRRADGTFAPGNPGRPRGTRNKATELAEKLMSDDAEAITNAVIAAAKAGDMTAAKIIFDRLAPPRRDRPIRVDLPEIACTSDAVAALGVLCGAMADGVVTPEEAGRAGRVIEATIRVGELADLAARLEALERSVK